MGVMSSGFENVLASRCIMHQVIETTGSNKHRTSRTHVCPTCTSCWASILKYLYRDRAAGTCHEIHVLGRVSIRDFGFSLRLCVLLGKVPNPAQIELVEYQCRRECECLATVHVLTTVREVVVTSRTEVGFGTLYSA